MRRLLINADDFGLTPGVNRAIAELYDAGCLRSTTLMATGAAFADAVALALARPSLGVGCHILLTDGVPVLPAQEIPSLVIGNHFRPTLGAFIRDLMLGRLDESEIEREAAAQIRRLQSAGLSVTHIDSHKHTHLFPAIVRPLARAALACGVHALRNPFEPAWSSSIGGGALRQFQLRVLNRLHDPFFAQFDSAAIATPDGTLGISATGSLTAETLPLLLDALPDEGAWELVCHPGHVDASLAAVTTRLRRHRELELAALLAHIPRALRIDSSLQLISYSDIRPSEAP